MAVIVSSDATTTRLHPAQEAGLQLSTTQSSASALSNEALQGSIAINGSLGVPEMDVNGNSQPNVSWYGAQSASVDNQTTRQMDHASSEMSLFSDVAGDLSAFYNQSDGIDSFLDMVDFSPSANEETIFQEHLVQSIPATSTHQSNIVFPTDASTRRPTDPVTSARPDQNNSFSRFGSPLPCLAFAPREPSCKDYNPSSPPRSSQPCWRISRLEHQRLMQRTETFKDVLPGTFCMPSRHSLSRYLEGCVRGLCEHLPFLHTPTFAPAEAAPELILAMAAIGAQFRFENNQSLVLFYTAKSIALEQVQRGDKNRVEELLSQNRSSAASLHSSVNVPFSRERQVESSKAQHENTAITKNNAAFGFRLQSIQALTTLLVMGAWGPRQLVREAISLQSLIATLVREEFVGSRREEIAGSRREEIAGMSEWRFWALMESEKRTKLAVYSMLQLLSIAYNTPPLMFSSEIDCNLPASAASWNAQTEEDWKMANDKCRVEEVSFRESLESLYRDVPARRTGVASPLANYVMILAILQHIFLRRQDASASKGQDLNPHDIEITGRALKRWQARWERSPESSIDPYSSAGPVAFNSTALLRLAWIRLHADFGPGRELVTRDVDLIFSAFKNCPPLRRGPELIYPVLQASYALAIPIRMGLNFVAKTQTLNWSVQHSLSNFECAIFLSKWLELMAIVSATTSLEKDELMLVHMIHSLLKETEFYLDDGLGDLADQRDQRRKIRWLATGVARIWAEIFKGAHVFEVVNTIGASLTTYAELMEDQFWGSDINHDA
jgi:hypothetical protein